MSLKSGSNLNYKNEYFSEKNNFPSESNYNLHTNKKVHEFPFSASNKNYSISYEFEKEMNQEQENNENEEFEKYDEAQYNSNVYKNGKNWENEKEIYSDENEKEMYSDENEKEIYYDGNKKEIYYDGNEKEIYYDENEKNIIEDNEEYVNNHMNWYYNNENKKSRNTSSKQLTNRTNNMLNENFAASKNSKENEYNSKKEEFINKNMSLSEDKIVDEFSKNIILNNLTSKILDYVKSEDKKEKKLYNNRSKKSSKFYKNSFYSKDSTNEEKRKYMELKNKKKSKNRENFDNIYSSSSIYEAEKKEKDNYEKKKKKLFDKNSHKGRKRDGKTKEFSVYEMKCYIPTSFESSQREKAENNNHIKNINKTKENKGKNKNKNVYFVDNNKNHHATYENNLCKSICYGNNLFNDQFINMQEKILLPYNNTINEIKTTNEIHNYPNTYDNYTNNNVNYGILKNCNNVNEANLLPQDRVYMNSSPNMVQIKNVIHKFPYTASNGIIKTKNEFYKIPAPSSHQKKFFCNSSRKNNLIKKDTDDLKTEILIYKNNELNNYNKKLMNYNIYNNDINRHNYFMPTSNNVFVRTRSLTPYSFMNKTNNRVSPLKNICLKRQKSLPILQINEKNPICTQEVSYIYSNPNNNIQNINDNTNIYNSSLPQNFTNTYLYPQHDEKKKNYIKKSSSQSFTKCSTASSMKNSNHSSTVNSEVSSLNQKIKKLNNKINNMNKENCNLNELSKMYKNECNRLRELFLKKNFAKGYSSNIDYVDYEKVNLELEEENEKLRSKMKILGKTILCSDDINGVKKVLAKQIVDLQEENEKYRNKIKLLNQNNNINNKVLFNLNKTDVSADAIDSIFMQTKNVIINGHESINIFYLSLKNLIDNFFEKIKYIIMNNEHTKKEKIFYVNNLEKIIKENFEEMNEIVLKINELRKNMKNMKANIFSISRGNPNCACKPSRIILEEDIKHLERELHKHSLMLKNLRKKNLSLSLNNIYSQHNKENENKDNSKDSFSNFYEKMNKNKIYENFGTTKNSYSKDENFPYNSLENENEFKISKKEDDFQSIEQNTTHSIKKNNISKLNENYLTLNNKNINEPYHSKLHDKIKIIEDQLNSLNKHINQNYSDEYVYNKNKKKTKKKDVFLVDKLIKNIKNDDNYFNNIDDINKFKVKTSYSFDEHIEESSYSENKSSNSSSSSSYYENENLPSNKKKNIRDEVEKSKKKMIELLAMLKGKDNDDLVENIQLHVNNFGKNNSQNKYNLKKIYDNLKAIKNTIKNTDDDTEKNILALIESQANEIKIFGNCVDDLKNTVAL